jgi:hypothetical protein
VRRRNWAGDAKENCPLSCGYCLASSSAPSASPSKSPTIAPSPLARLLMESSLGINAPTYV